MIPSYSPGLETYEVIINKSSRQSGQSVWLRLDLRLIAFQTDFGTVAGGIVRVIVGFGPETRV